jgi:hypothetical protein
VIAMPTQNGVRIPTGGMMTLCQAATWIASEAAVSTGEFDTYYGVSSSDWFRHPLDQPGTIDGRLRWDLETAAIALKDQLAAGSLAAFGCYASRDYPTPDQTPEGIDQTYFMRDEVRLYPVGDEVGPYPGYDGDHEPDDGPKIPSFRSVRFRTRRGICPTKDES